MSVDCPVNNYLWSSVGSGDCDSWAPEEKIFSREVRPLWDSNSRPVSLLLRTAEPNQVVFGDSHPTNAS